MKQIVKVIFQDGTELTTSPELKIEPIEYFEKQHRDSGGKYNDNHIEYISKRSYKRQFQYFEEDILYHLNEDNVKSFAEDELDMINEDDVEEKDLSDFSSREIIEYCKLNGLIEDISSIPNNLIAQSVFEDIPKLFKKYSAIELSEIIEDLLKK